MSRAPPPTSMNDRLFPQWPAAPAHRIKLPQTLLLHRAERSNADATPANPMFAGCLTWAREGFAAHALLTGRLGAAALR